MNIFTKITLRNLKLNKKRTLGTIIGIMLSVALICAVAGMATSLQKTLIATTVEDTGYYHLKLSDVTNDDVEKFKNNRDIKDVNVINDIGYSILENSKNENKPYIHLYSLDETAFNNMSLELVDGRYPRNSDEIVINQGILNSGGLNYKIGDKIKLNIGERYAGEDYITSGYEYEAFEYMNTPEGTSKNIKEKIKVNINKEFTIVGIMSENDGPIKPISFMNDAGYTCITNGLEEGKKNIYIALNKPQDANNSFREMIGLDMESGNFSNTEYIFSINYELLRWESFNSSDATLSMLMAVISVTIIIIMLTSIYCIKNAFAISLTEKIKMYGMLSSIGATKKQIKKSVIKEGMLLSLIGIPLGIILGILAVVILITIVKGILGELLEADIVFYVPIWPIIISIILGIITIYFSCLSAAKKSKKITPMEAIRSTNEIKINSKNIKCPKIIKKLFGIGGVIAYKNLKRNKKKYRTTVISIAMSVFVFLAASTLIEYSFKTMGGYYKDYDYNIRVSSVSQTRKELYDIIQNENLSDYSILYDVDASNNVENKEELEKEINEDNKEEIQIVDSNYEENNRLEITDTSNVTDFGNRVLNLVYEGDKTEEKNPIELTIIGLNSKDFKEYISQLGLDYSKVSKKGILSDYFNLYDNGKTIRDRLYKYNKNDTIEGKLNNKDLKINIAGITDIYPKGIEDTTYRGIIVVNIDEFDEYLDFKPYMLTIQSDEPDDLAKHIEDTYGDINVFNIAKEARFYDSINLVISIFAYGFIAVITLIGVTNIFNTLTSNIELRQKEFAMLKSIGMTKKEFNRMINLETIFYSLKALLYGIIFGLIASFAIYKAFAQSLDYGFKIPLQAIIISIIFVFVIIFIIMRFAIRKINKQNIIETIRKENV